MEEIKKDKRFAHILTNPKYFKMGRKENKLKLDSRFKEMFKSKDFKIKYTVDSRGRPWISSTKEDLKKYYELTSSEEIDDEVHDTKLKKKKGEKHKNVVEITSLNKIEVNIKKKDENKIANADFKEELCSKEANKTSTTLKNNATNSRKKSKLPSNQEKCNNNLSNSITSSSNKSQDKHLLINMVRDKIKEKSFPKSDNTYGKENKSNKCYESSNESTTFDHDADASDDDSNASSDNDEDFSSDDDDSFKDVYKSEILNGESDDDTSEEEEVTSKEMSHAWGELDHDAPRTESITSRLALCNMDWDRLKADDILVMLGSFKPENGVINCVKIYLSEYGKERLEIEKFKGPPELTQDTTKNNIHSNTSDAGNDNSDIEDNKSDVENVEDSSNFDLEGSKYNREKLRQYQLSRLKYYYAIVECDSSSTADFIYNNCNGIEYESSANLIDLRFVPETMEFDGEPISFSSSPPSHGTYKPTLYTSTALHQTNVELTWDETPADRVAVTMRDFSKVDFENMDVKDYLASASEDEGELDGEMDEKDGLTDVTSIDEQIRKYKDLLCSLDDGNHGSGDDLDMEITWEPGLKETVEQKLEEKKSSELTPWEKYLDKKSKKKKQKKNYDKANLVQEESDTINKSRDRPHKRNDPTEKEQAELELLVMDGKIKNNLDLKQKKNKKNKKDKLTDSLKSNFVDARFKEIVSDPRFNIDPSANEYHKIKKIKL